MHQVWIENSGNFWRVFEGSICLAVFDSLDKAKIFATIISLITSKGFEK
jgi:hypothetical protein